MELSDFTPIPTLVAGQTEILKPCHPVIDAHTHLGVQFGGGWDQRPISELLAVLDEARVEILVDLDGGWGEDLLDAHLKKFKEAAPERFCIFGGVDWNAWPEHGNHFPEWAAARLRAQKDRGAQGVKIWKPFGLQICDPEGRLVSVDDPRLDPIWETAAELKLPVMVHVADPVAFFQPLDARNERWEELHAHPEWQFPSPPYPPFEKIVNDFANLIARHPHTTFIGAHVGCYAENLAWVGQVLERCPNFYVDISARLAELGRQPYTARRFFLNYADRILFGTDHPAQVEDYRLHYRFLESDDEYFEYGLRCPPSQGRWRVYGLYLPPDILENIYSLNVRKIISS